MKWTDIVGHLENIKIVQYMVSSGRVPHAILLTGAEGIGKSMVGAALSMALLCTASEDKPCGKCQSCLHMSHETHPDFLRIGPDGTTIKIEQIRKLQHEVILAPYMGSRRICLIDGAEFMTVQAANSLLKILEEPLGDVVFILVAGNRQLLLPTILSRCMSLAFQPLSAPLLAQALCAKGFSTEQAEVAARLSRGRMGNAQAILEPGGLVLRNQVMEIVENLAVRQMADLWDTAILLEKMERKDLLQVVDHFSYLLRDLLMLTTGQGWQVVFNIDKTEKLAQLVTHWSELKLLKALQVIETARRALHGNANARLTSEALLIKIYDIVREV